MGKKRRNAMRIVFALLLLAYPLHISAELCRFNVGNIDFFYRLPKEQHKDSQIMVLFGGRNWTGDKAIKTFNFEELADKYSLILLSPSFKDNEYWLPEKWSGKALKSAVKLLEKKFSLKPQKLLFYGYSAGGQCANLFYNYMPKEVEAWGLHACGVYPVSTAKNGVSSFITCGLQDSDRVRISKRFIYKYRENGGKVIWKEYYKCPKCGKYVPFKWENIEWDDNYKDENGEYDFAKINQNTALKCAECGEYFEDTDRMRRILNKDGKFIPLNPNAAKENVGFHWNALASMSWGKLAELYLRAKIAARKGDSCLLQQFYQKRLALAWREFAEDYRLEIASGSYNSGDVWDEEAGFNKLGEIIAPPFAENEVIAPLRIMSVDVQMNCFYLVVRAWSINGSSRLLWHEKVLTWEDIEEIQKRFKILDNLVFVDAGYNSFEVYKHCGERNWIALMGDNRANFFHRLPNGKTVLRFYSPVKHIFISRYVKCRMHFWSNLNVKDTLARIRQNQNPADGATWEVPTDISEDYLKQMESEHRIKKGNSWIWEQIGNRPNH